MGCNCSLGVSCLIEKLIPLSGVFSSIQVRIDLVRPVRFRFRASCPPF